MHKTSMAYGKNYLFYPCQTGQTLAQCCQTQQTYICAST